MRIDSRRLGADVAGILHYAEWLAHVHVLQPERCQYIVAGARQKREGEEGAVAFLDVCTIRHRGHDMTDLLDGRPLNVTLRLGDGRVL